MRGGDDSQSGHSNSANSANSDGAPKGLTDAENVRRLTREVDTARDDLGHLVDRLDRKRHAVARKLPLILISLALIGVAAGGIAIAVSRRRRRQQLPSKLRGLGAALRRVSAEPERLAGDAGTSRKVAGGAATAASSVLAKLLAEKLLTPAVPVRR
jgi:hypothetical protein